MKDIICRLNNLTNQWQWKNEYNYSEREFLGQMSSSYLARELTNILVPVVTAVHAI